MIVSHNPPTGGTTPTRALAVSSVALFTGILVHGLAVPVLPRLPAIVGAGSAAMGVLFASYAAAVIVTTLFADRVVDRHGPRTPLLIGLGDLAAAILLFAAGGPYWLLVATRLAQGTADGMFWVAALYLIDATTPVEKRSQSMDAALSTIILGVFVSPPPAGLPTGHFGTASPFLFAAAVTVVDGTMQVILVKGSPWVTDDVAGPLAMLRVPGSFSIVLAVVVGAAAPSGVEPMLSVYLKASSLVIGLLFGLTMLALITANPIVGRFVAAVSPRLFVRSDVVAAATAFMVIDTADEMRRTSAGIVLLGASSALLLTPSITLINQRGSHSVPLALDESLALCNLAYAGGLAGGPLLTGLTVQRARFAATMVVTATVLAGLGIVTVARLPRSLQKSVDLA